MKVTATKIPAEAFDVELCLPYDVAVSLLVLTRKIAGNKFETFRAHTEEIHDALAPLIRFSGIDDGRFSGSIAAAKRNA